MWEVVVEYFEMQNWLLFLSQIFREERKVIHNKEKPFSAEEVGSIERNAVCLYVKTKKTLWL
jgi:hypothetical protein